MAQFKSENKGIALKDIRLWINTQKESYDLQEKIEIMNQNNVKKRLFGECWNPSENVDH